jgi:hypothetical protein
MPYLEIVCTLKLMPYLATVSTLKLTSLAVAACYPACTRLPDHHAYCMHYMFGSLL